MSWLAAKRILVTGGAGFLGKYVVKRLEENGCKEIFVPRSKDYNLVEMEAAKRLLRDAKPDIVINLAARTGGIEATRKKPAEFFYENLMIGVQLMEQARLFGIEKFDKVVVDWFNMKLPVRLVQSSQVSMPFKSVAE